MQRIAIVINTQYGQTEKIALWLRQRLTPFSKQVHIFKIVEPNDSIKVDLTSYDMVIIGAPVYAQNFSKELIQWAKTFSATLHSKVCALYTVSGNAGDLRPQARAADDMLLRKFIDETGIQPNYVASFGGAIHYTKYNFFLKIVMKGISKKAGGSTDTSRDLELTNWNDVDAFVHAILDEDVLSRYGYMTRFAQSSQSKTQAVTDSPMSYR